MSGLTSKQQQQHAEARLRLQRGDVRGAREILAGLAAMAPRHLQVLGDLATAHMAGGAASEAIPVLERLIRLGPGQASAHHCLALCLRDVRRFHEATTHARRAVELDSANPAFRFALAEIRQITGDAEEAFELLSALPASPPVRLSLGRAARQTGRVEESEHTLRLLTEEQGVPVEIASEAGFELGILLDRLGRYDEAWNAIARANDRQPDRFDHAHVQEIVRRLIAAWTPEAIARVPTSSERSTRPIFILGMLRSGTSLVEQILDSHPDVTGGGERSGIRRIIESLQKRPKGPQSLDDLSTLTPSVLDASARQYLKELHEVDAGARHVTDKQPFNFLYLALITRLFPAAKIIHCRRDPRDTALSCYFQSFRGTVHFANRPASIAAFFSMYEQVMAHWARVLPGAFLTINYEALVTDPRSQVQRLLDHLGLPWHESCLSFHTNPRVAWTASIEQVRRPMYDSSIGRWKHYAAAMSRAGLLLEPAPGAGPSDMALQRRSE